MTPTAISRDPNPGTLYDVIDVILDKGLVVDAFVRVSLVGIELLTIDARIVIASVDTYLHFAEAADRLDLSRRSEQPNDLPDMFGGGGKLASGQGTQEAIEEGKGVVKEGVEKLRSSLRSDSGGSSEDDENDEDEKSRK